MDTIERLEKFKLLLNTANIDRSDIDKVIKYLKTEGASQAETVWVLVKGMNISLREADEKVLNSPVWAEMKDINESVRNIFFDSEEPSSDF